MYDSIATPSTTPSFIDLNDPRLYEPAAKDIRPRELVECDPATGQVRLIEDPSRHQSRDTKEYILGLIAEQEEKAAYAAYDCGAKATKDRWCPNGEYAHASHCCCHDRFSRCCGRAKIAYGYWMNQRSESHLCSVPHTFFELVLPWKESDEGSSPALSVSNPRGAQTNIHMSPRSARIGRDRLMELATLLGNKLDPNTLVLDCIDPTRHDVRVRVAIPSLSARYKQVAAEWKAIAGSDAWVENLHSTGAGSETREGYLWAFAGLDGILVQDGRERAYYKAIFRKAHLVRASGDFYRVLTQAELEERASKKALTRQWCPVCKEPHLVMVAPKDRIQERTQDLEAAFRIVDYSSDYDPFHQGRKELSIRGSLMDNSTFGEPQYIAQSRYGPN